jgi:hypothetical protein
MKISLSEQRGGDTGMEWGMRERERVQSKDQFTEV